MPDQNTQPPTRLFRKSLGRKVFPVWVAIPAAIVLVAAALAPVSSADPTDDLRAAVAAKRANCPPLAADPVLDQVAQRADLETQSYTNHTARFLPMEDPMPMLHQLSYPASKAKLLTGFAGHDRPDPVQTAVFGAALFGSDAIADCSYNRYGADTLADPGAGYAVAAVVLAGN